MRSAITIAGIAALCCRIAPAQLAATPRFETAVIRRSAPDSDTFMKAHPGGRIEISRATLQTLTAFAWRLQPFQVSGGPSWVRAEYFDVQTKALETPSEDQLFLMLQTLFQERFSLKLHRESAQRPVYVLVPRRAGRTPPAGLQVSTGSCAEADAAPPSGPNADACESIGMGVNHLEAHGICMARFAEALARVMDRKVIDRTGRTEKFNIVLRWLPDEHQTIPASDAMPLPADTPSIFTALREQLGLRLEPAKAAVELLVIDHAERPGEN